MLMVLFNADKLLEKDVKKSKISSDEAQAIKNRVKTVNSISAFGSEDVQLVMEVSLPMQLRSQINFDIFLPP